MMVVYLVMLCLPLAAYAISPAGKSARECSGDCTVCGCSPASSAAGTCCCAKKRQQQAHLHADDDNDEPECCKKEHGEKKVTVIACGCPCGTEPHDLLSLSSPAEALPCRFNKEFSVAASATVYHIFPHRLESRTAEPPLPPPKLSLVA
jgi:hypothetical protein